MENCDNTVNGNRGRWNVEWMRMDKNVDRQRKGYMKKWKRGGESASGIGIVSGRENRCKYLKTFE